MGVEALPARFDFLPRSPRSFFSVDLGADGLCSVLTRRFSDSESSLRGLCRKSSGHGSSKVSVDGGAPIPGFPARAARRDKGVKRGPSCSLRPESSSCGLGSPEQSGPLGLFRWKSDVSSLTPRATRFGDFPGDRWRRSEDELCEVETYQGFDKPDVDFINTSVAGVQEVGREWRNVPTRYESHATGDRKHIQIGTASEASAVDVTAPNFVIDREFLDRRQHPGGGLMSDGLDVSFADGHMGGPNRSSRPASLQCKSAATVCTARDPASGEGPINPIGLGGRAECLSIPASLRNLKKRNGRARARSGDGVCAIKKAFDSMVFMIRALQSYTLQMRKVLVSDTDVQHLLSLVHREMHSSFVWLFQQVFSCTPTLMVSVMILLANFTVFSLGNNVAIGAVVSPDPPTELVSILQNPASREGPVMRAFHGKDGFSFVRLDRSLDCSPPSSPSDVGSVSAGHGFGDYGPGGIGGRSVVVAGAEDGDYNGRGAFSRNAMFSERESNTVDLHSASGHPSISRATDNLRPGFAPNRGDVIGRSDGRSWTVAQEVTGEETSIEQLSYQSLLEQTARELELKPGEPYHHVELDQETLRRLVAPVSTKMETDNYLCFDRTDLEYQHAISAEPSNPMLLANYAQFLYVVRHDNKRAERLFHRALRADSEDGDILGRWATFLWLALKDRGGAERAYRAAISLDPSNPFHAGSYAHYLWRTGDDELPPPRFTQ